VRGGGGDLACLQGGVWILRGGRKGRTFSTTLRVKIGKTCQSLAGESRAVAKEGGGGFG